MKPLGRPRVWLVGVIAMALLAWAAAGVSLLRAAWFDQQLQEAGSIAVDESSDPELVFAKAFAAAAGGDHAAAYRWYGTLLEVADVGLRQRVRYNLGTLYLRDAARLWNARGVLEYVRVNTLVAAAKEHLRMAVRLNPGDEDARFNLEYAYRITPPPKERPKENFQGSKGSVFATLPSIPGGGP